MKSKLVSAAIAAASMFCTGAALALPSYLPVGPQTGVALGAVTGGGWTQCYVATMSVYIGDDAENVLNVCQGDFLMMAGRETGATTFLALAASLRSDTILDTGNGSTTHVANGSQWWYSDDWSWGFAGLNDIVSNSECNVGAAPISMCLHTVNNAGGYRINDIQGLNQSTAFEKVFFVANRADLPEPGVLALASIAMLGAAGAGRRRARR